MDHAKLARKTSACTHTITNPRIKLLRVVLVLFVHKCVISFEGLVSIIDYEANLSDKFGKISISFVTVISGSCIYTFFNHKEWSSVLQNHVQFQFSFPSIISTGLRLFGSFVSHFPKQSLDLTQSDHFYIRTLAQQLVASAQYPVDFDLKSILRERSLSTFLSLARNPLYDDALFSLENEVVQQSDYEKLKGTFRDLLSFLPTSGHDSCAKWFTDFAFHGGKSGYNLYKTISWGPGDETDLDSITPEEAISLFLKALHKHSEVQSHRSLIIENNGLDLLRVVAQQYSDINTTRFLSRILGNLTLDETSHCTIVNDGWVERLRNWLKSEDFTIRSNSFRALANLDREGEKGYVYENGIFVVYPTKQLKCCKPEVDLVFIHGLRGSPFTTWRSSDQNKDRRTDCWPGDWFPSDVPSCRVILVEYDTELSDWTSKCPLQPEISSIEYRSSELMRKLMNAGVGQRPVIWVSHSMGGLLVKRLLVDASKSDNFGPLSSNTSGVVFYSVPHKGSDVATLVSGKARFVFRPSSEVKELQKGSELLEHLHVDFLKCVNEGQINVLSYGETEPARIVNRETLIVPRESADFGVGEFVPLPVNHFAVCKPTNRFDPCYFKTVEFVKKHLWKPDLDDYDTVLLF